MKANDVSEIEESGPELFGVNPRVITVFMILLTVIVPFGYLPPGSAIFCSFVSEMETGIYGLLWFFGFAIDFGYGYGGFHVLRVGLTILAIVLSIFNILFAREIVRYYQGKTSQKQVVFIGVVSLIYPNLFTLIPVPLYIFGIIWPIPIQFIAGLILLYKIPGPELLPTTPE